MDESEIREIVCNVFLGGDLDFPIDTNTRLLEEGICDSLGLVQIVSEVEKRLPGIKIDDREITRDNFATIATIKRFIDTKKES